jgi:hypothetical protein
MLRECPSLRVTQDDRERVRRAPRVAEVQRRLADVAAEERGGVLPAEAE